MKVIKMALSQIKRPERNIRIHSDKQLKEFERSIKQFGQIRPIVVDENNVILAGNGLYETLLRLNYVEADVYQFNGLSERQKKKLMMSDNKIFTLGVDDLDTFNAFLEELQDDLDIPGYDEHILKSMMADAEEITDMLSGYGTISQEEIKTIELSGERKRQMMVQDNEGQQAPITAYQENQTPAPNNLTVINADNTHIKEEHTDLANNGQTPNHAPLSAIIQPQTTPITRTLICPRCGEVICL